MRSCFAFFMLLTGIALLPTACGGNVADQTPSGNNATGGQGVIGEPSASGGGEPSATGGTGNGLTGGITPITQAQFDQINASACAGTNSEDVDSNPILLEFVVDTSASMADVTPNSSPRSKWEVTRDALLVALDSVPDSDTVGLLLVPNQATVPNDGTISQPIDNCVNTAAAVAPQPPLGAAGSSQRQALASALSSANIEGGKPTQDAYEYAFNEQLLPALSTYGYFTSIMVLMTDGPPTIALGCEGAGQSTQPVDTQPLIQDITDVATGSPSVKTLVIGLPSSAGTSATGSDPRIWMSEAARAGQTSVTPDCSDTGVPNFCHVNLTGVTDLQGSIVSALQSAAVPPVLSACSFKVPPPTDGSQVIDPTRISFIYKQNVVNGVPTALLLIEQSNPDCSRGDGWYWDTDTSSLTLCAKTCAMIQQDRYAQIEIRAACFVQLGGP